MTKFPPAQDLGDYPVTVKELSKSYDNHVVFKRRELFLFQEEKVALLMVGMGKVNRQ